MEPIHHLLMLRRRWRTLLIGAVLGAVLAGAWLAAAATTETEPVQHYSATHELIVDPDAAAVLGVPNLLQVALEATGGEVPEQAAARLGLDPDEVTPRVRTVTELGVSVIEVSAVATDPDEARRIADVFAETLVAHVGQRDTSAYENRLAAARSEVRRRTDDLERAETALSDLQSDVEAAATIDAEQPAIGDVELDELRDRLDLARMERDRRTGLLAEAVEDLEALQRNGPPPGLLRTLDVVAPVEISAAEYRRRVDDGRRGDNNWSSRDVPSTERDGDGLGGVVADPRVRILVAALAGSVAAAGLILAQLRFDTRVRTRREVEDAFGLPLLTEVPMLERSDRRRAGVHAHRRPRSAVSESYRMVRSAILFDRPRPGTQDGRAGWVVMVTSPGAAEGKTTTTANLGVLLAESGLDVLVVNCDHRLPRLHDQFGCAYTPRRAILTGIERVTLVADVLSGEENPTAIVDAQRDLVERARHRYDVVLLDTAPVLATNDALALLPVTDEVLLVAREGATDRDAAADAVELLRRHEANPIGVVLTASSGFGRSRYYHRNYGDDCDRTGATPGGGEAKTPRRRRVSRPAAGSSGRSAEPAPRLRSGGEVADPLVRRPATDERASGRRTHRSAGEGSTPRRRSPFAFAHRQGRERSR